MTLKLGKNHDVWVDITDSGDMFEAWLYRKGVGIKDYMRPNSQMIKILNNKRRVYYGKKIRKS